SILMQLCTGHAPLQKHLYAIHRADEPTCPCCKQHPETVYHFLMECLAHKNSQDCLRRRIRQRNFTYSALLTTVESLRDFFQYINETGRFRHIVGE
ncbi:hypothetical protein BT96DRAFT_749479, partial [Gymnopus androsaceus JB14]